MSELDYGKLSRQQKLAVFLIITLSSIGLPGLNGFVGEFLILLGAFRWNPRFASFAALGVILSAVYMLWMFQRVNYGEITNHENARLPDLSGREWAAVGPAVVMAVVMGVAPMFFLRPMEPAVNELVNRVTSRQKTVVMNTPGSGLVCRSPRSAARKNASPATCRWYAWGPTSSPHADFDAYDAFFVMRDAQPPTGRAGKLDHYRRLWVFGRARSNQAEAWSHRSLQRPRNEIVPL